jgi:hypothetical protein
MGTPFHVAQAKGIHASPGDGHPTALTVQRPMKGNAGHRIGAQGHAMQHSSLAAAPDLNLLPGPDRLLGTHLDPAPTRAAGTYQTETSETAESQAAQRRPYILQKISSFAFVAALA